MSDICVPHLKNIWDNEIVSNQQFLCLRDDLKLADARPVFSDPHMEEVRFTEKFH